MNQGRVKFVISCITPLVIYLVLNVLPLFNILTLSFFCFFTSRVAAQAPVAAPRPVRAP